jgi:acetyltransferase-like isoleucine patch superfamily enzyme
MNSTFKKIRFKIFRIISINWTGTLYFNYKMLPLKHAKKLPFIFYGKVMFSGLNGEIIFNVPIRQGLCEFGKNLEIIKSSAGNAEIRIDGKMIIDGEFSTGNDYNLQILPKGEFRIGGQSYLGRQTKILCTHRITIGNNFRFGFESQISDSNYHYIIDLNDNSISRINGSITIGNYCWIGNRTSIMKGSKLPNSTIVASNSLLNKDYTSIIDERSIIGGIPAKLLKSNSTRIFDSDFNKQIREFFIKHPELEYLKLPLND